MPNLRSLLLALGLTTLVSTPALAQDGGFHYFGGQLLYGAGFDDPSVGHTPSDGQMLTLTLENFTEWAWGDSYLFFDLTSGAFGEGPGDPFHIYGEWNPRLSLSKVFGTKVGALFIDDVLLAGEVNRGAGFNALLVGPGFNLRVPGVPVLQLHTYLRKDNFNPFTWQVTAVWLAPFQTGPLRFTFGGFVDVYQLSSGGLDVMTQPQLLWDVGALAGAPAERVKVGVEWYLHRSRGILNSVPQGMVRVAY